MARLAAAAAALAIRRPASQEVVAALRPDMVPAAAGAEQARAARRETGVLVVLALAG
jgi:hypothetical protein